MNVLKYVYSLLYIIILIESLHSYTLIYDSCSLIRVKEQHLDSVSNRSWYFLSLISIESSINEIWHKHSFSQENRINVDMQ